MNRQVDLGRRLTEHFDTEAPNRAPEWVLSGALSTIAHTRQRRVIIPAPWRIPNMNGFSKLAATAVAVVLVGILGITAFGPGFGGPARSPAPPTPAAAPTGTPAAAPTGTPAATAGPTQAVSTPFEPTFTYTFPTGVTFDYGQRNETYFEVRVPEYSDAGTPGGIIIQSIGGGRADPCDRTSATRPIGQDPLSTINYLNTIPQLTVTNQRAVSVDGRPAHEVAVVAAPETADCEDLWLWTEDTESFGSIPRGLVLRMIAFDVFAEHLVITIYGEGENEGWKELADEFIGSIEFS